MRQVANKPDVSDLLDTIQRAQVLGEQQRAAEEAAKQAMAELITRYERAGVPVDECDHPLYTHRSADSINACCYCQQRQPQPVRTRKLPANQ